MKTVAIFIIIFILSIVSSYSQEFTGDWSGTTKRGDKEIILDFNIEQEKGFVFHWKTDNCQFFIR